MNRAYSIEQLRAIAFVATKFIAAYPANTIAHKDRLFRAIHRWDKARPMLEKYYGQKFSDYITEGR
jgi:hypothetical protein